MCKILGPSDSFRLWCLFEHRGVWSKTPDDVRALEHYLSDPSYAVLGIGGDVLEGAGVLCFDLGVPRAWSILKIVTRRGSGCMMRLRHASAKHAEGRGCDTLYYKTTARNAACFERRGPFAGREQAVVDSDGPNVTVRVRHG